MQVRCAPVISCGVEDVDVLVELCAVQVLLDHRLPADRESASRASGRGPEQGKEQLR
jgi:hypothetical protein